MRNYVYCAVNENNDVQWVMGSHRKTRCFKSTRYLRGAVRRHNEANPDDPWYIQKYAMIEADEREEV